MLLKSSCLLFSLTCVLLALTREPLVERKAFLRIGENIFCVYSTLATIIRPGQSAYTSCRLLNRAHYIESASVHLDVCLLCRRMTSEAHAQLESKLVEHFKENSYPIFQESELTAVWEELKNGPCDSSLSDTLTSLVDGGSLGVRTLSAGKDEVKVYWLKELNQHQETSNHSLSMCIHVDTVITILACIYLHHRSGNFQHLFCDYQEHQSRAYSQVDLAMKNLLS